MNCVADRTGKRLSLGDIIAKAEGVAGELKTSEYRPMLRKLIEPRFQLKLKGERRLLKGFDLVRAEREGAKRVGSKCRLPILLRSETGVVLDSCNGCQ